MKRILFILLFVCVGSLSFATGLDLTYEIPTNNDQYVINKYALDPEEKAAFKKVLKWVLIISVVQLALGLMLLNSYLT